MDYDFSAKKLKFRVYFTFFILCFSLLIVFGRIVYLQFVIGDELIAYSQSQFIRTTKVYPNRGNIYDRTGSPFAINVRRYNIFAMPQQIQKTKNTLRKINQIIPELKVSRMYKKIAGRDKFTWLGRNLNLSEEQVASIEELKGVYLESTSSRFYPNHESLSQVIGFVGIDNKGLAGVEYQFDNILKGKEKTISFIRDAKGRALKFENLTEDNKSQDIYLSIDKDTQGIVEKYLKEGVQFHKADRGGAAVINGETGEILAMANFPTYDPNEITRGDALSRNLAFISDPFEPGSILKTVTIASALENNVVQPETIYYCEKGRFKVGKHTISESSNHKYEWLSVFDILKLSSNIGTTKLAFDLGFEKLSNTFHDFGFGQKTGIELPSESRGIFERQGKIKDIRLSNLSFGQGIATTGIQMLSAYVPFTNGGFLVKPTILRRETRPERIQVIGEKTANRIVKNLQKVVEEGTGTKAQIEGFDIAGKTGTAQKPSKDGGYDGYISSFIGFPLNVKNPFVLLVYIDNPKEKGYYGNEVAAPIFKKIAEKLLIKNEEFKNLALNNEENKKLEDVIKMQNAATEKYVEGTVPNFVGLDKRSVIKRAEELKIRLRINGYGIVQKQWPRAHTKLGGDRTIKVELTPPVYE